MSNIPADLKYAKTHEWSRLEGDGTVTVGITDHAQYLLGDLVFIELPEVGRQVTAGKEVAVVESVKAASDIYAPLDGTISAVITASLTRAQGPQWRSAKMDFDDVNRFDIPFPVAARVRSRGQPHISDS